ncbi:hypothetical protein QTP88_018123 [Uroleucon formosanum]
MSGSCYIRRTRRCPVGAFLNRPRAFTPRPWPTATGPAIAPRAASLATEAERSADRSHVLSV